MAPLQAELERRLAAGADAVPALADWLLAAAAQKGASDLHLEPREDALLVRWRIDGCLADAGEIKSPLRANLVQRVKVLAALLTYRTDVPQDGRIAGATIPGVTDMRVSVYPAVLGEKVVVRFFHGAAASKNGSRPDLRIADLGLDARDAERLAEYLARPQGLLLLTGPAGSGKTTTLYACLRQIVELDLGRRQVVTIEDPVERVTAGVTHTELKPAAGLDYPKALRALLRQDPEVIMIGEIRDAETAQVAVQAALTGHLILSTVHAPSAPEVLLRLAHLGVEPYLIASTLGAVIEQRLLRKLCEKCREPRAGHAAEPFAAKGCEACAGTGYRGRLLVAELLPVANA
ncbi:MAG: type II/IV secretion system protein, partial [Planctomycetota bacterium]|nr:type II/IV secretion system protein [Planctomycetota bacterium]